MDFYGKTADFASCCAAAAAERIALNGYAAIQLGAAQDCDLAYLQSATATIVEEYKVLEPDGAPAAAAIDTAGGVAGLSLPTRTETESKLVYSRRRPGQFPSLYQLAVRGLPDSKPATSQLQKKLERVFCLAAALALKVIDRLSGFPSTGPQFSQLLKGMDEGTSFGSGGGSDREGSISDLTIYHRSCEAGSDDTQHDASVLTVAFVPAGDCSFQLKDRKTGQLFAPAVSAAALSSSSSLSASSSSSSPSSSASTWVAVLFAGILYDAICGSGDCKLAVAHRFQPNVAPGGASASSSSSSAAPLPAALSGFKRPRSETSQHTHFLFRLLPSASYLGPLAKKLLDASKPTVDDPVQRTTIDIWVVRDDALSNSNSSSSSSGEMMTFRVKPTATLRSFEAQVSRAAGMKRGDGVFLFLKGALLKNNEEETETLESLDIHDGASLRLRTGPARISVICKDGRALTLDVDPETDDAADILDMIRAAKVDLQGCHCLRTAVDSKWLLQGHGPVGDMGVADRSVLHLVPAPGTLCVELPGGTTLEVGVHPDDFSSSFEDAVSEATGVSPDRQYYSVKATRRWLLIPGRSLYSRFSSTKLAALGVTDRMHLKLTDGTFGVRLLLPSGQEVQLKVGFGNFLWNLKAAIEARTGIPAYDQYLFHNGEPLTIGHMTLGTSDVLDEDIIEVRQGPFKITVEAVETGFTFDIFASSDDSIHDLKRKIQDKCGVRPAYQHVKYQGQWLRQFHFGALLAQQPHEEFRLQLLPGPIDVRFEITDGRVLQTKCHPLDSLVLAIDAAYKHWAPPTDKLLVPRNSYIAVDGRWAVRADKLDIGIGMSLADFGAADGSTVQVLDGSTVLTLQREDGTVLASINVHCSASFDSLRSAIYAATGVPPHDQYLMYDWDWLRSDQSLLSVRTFVREGSLVLQPGSLPITVNVVGGASLQLNCYPYDDVRAIRRKILAVAGIPIAEQSLAPVPGVGDRLWVEQTLEELQIDPGTTIALCHGAIPVNFRAGSDQAPVPVTVLTSDNVEDVLAKIKAQTGDTYPGLKVRGLEMLPHWTVGAYGIQPGAEIVPGEGTMSVNISMSDELGSRKSFSLRISGQCTANDLRLIIEAMQGRRLREHRIRLPDGHRLAGETLASVGIKDGDDIRIYESRD